MSDIFLFEQYEDSMSSGTVNISIDHILRAFLIHGVYGVAWVDKSNDEFKINWKHGGRKDWGVSDATVSTLYCLIKGLCNVHKDYGDYTHNFWEAMDKSGKIRLVVNHRPPAKSCEESYRIYQFTEPPHQPSIDKCMEVLSSITGHSASITPEISAGPITDGHDLAAEFARCAASDRSPTSDNPDLGCSTSYLNTTVLDFSHLTNGFLLNLSTDDAPVSVKMPVLTSVPSTCQSDSYTTTAMTHVALDPSPHDYSTIAGASPCCEQMLSTIYEYGHDLTKLIKRDGPDQSLLNESPQDLNDFDPLISGLGHSYGGDHHNQRDSDSESRFPSTLNCSINMGYSEEVAEYRQPARVNMVPGGSELTTLNPPDGRMHIVTPVTPTLAAGSWLTGTFFSAVDTRTPSSPHKGISPMDCEESTSSPKMLNRVSHDGNNVDSRTPTPPKVPRLESSDAQRWRKGMPSSIAKNAPTSPIPDMQHFQDILSYLEDGDITTGESARPPIFHPPAINGGTWDMERMADLEKIMQEDNARPMGNDQPHLISDYVPSIYDQELSICDPEPMSVDPSLESPISFTMSPRLFDDSAHTHHD